MTNPIQAATIEYEVPFLVHFTRTTNLPSIMGNGLLPRSMLADYNVKAEINDELRLDGELGAISLSVGFPNSKMLWKLRQENSGVNWAVLAISRDILWENTCAFCKHNAADARISCLSKETLNTPDAFKSMYADIDGFDRGGEKLKKFDPTDVQAEILAFGRIDPQKILGVAFQRNAIKSQYEANFPNRKIVSHGDRGFFSDRAYHRRNSK